LNEEISILPFFWLKPIPGRGNGSKQNLFETEGS